MAALFHHRHRSLESLLSDLADLPPPRDPFVPHHILPAGPGSTTTLELALARRLGVAAHLATPPLRAFLDDLFHADASGTGATGLDDAPSRPSPDPWSADALLWPCLDALLAHRDDPEVAARLPARHPDAPPAIDATTLVLARRLAESLARTLRDAPDRLRSPDLEATRPAALPAWQVRLWRHVEAATRPLAAAHPLPSERLHQLAERLLAADPATLAALPPHAIAVVGHHTLTDTATLRALDALATHRDIHLFTLDTHPAVDRLGARHRAALQALEASRRAPWLTARSLDHQYSDLQPSTPQTAPPSTLSRLQEALLDPEPHPIAPAAPADPSVVLHLAESRLAQVERLRDALLSLLDADPTLELRDIHIATPDVAGLSPLLDAILTERLAPSDAPDPAAPPPLAARTADLPEQRQNPLADALVAALRLPDSGLSLPAVIDFLAHPAVMVALDLDGGTLDACGRWFIEAGIRWGRDAAYRARLGHPAREAGTFRHGFDRLLLGHALPARDDLPLQAPFDRIAPVASVEGSEKAALGRVIDMLLDIFDALDDAPLPVSAWRDRLASLATRLAGRHADTAAWLEPLLSVAFTWSEAAPSPGPSSGSAPGSSGPSSGSAPGSPGPERLLTFSAARRLTEDALAAPPRARPFPAGGITVGPLAPLRARPARVIALVGLDADGLRPPHAPASFDLLSETHPTARHDDEKRLALVEHVLAASEHLLLFATPLAPHPDRPELAAPQALLPILRALDDVAPDWRQRGRITRVHPEQRWDFLPPAPAARPAPPSQGAPLGPLPNVLPLERLANLLAEPHKHVVRDILGVSLPDLRSPADRDLLDPDHLDRWQVGERLLGLRLRGVPEATARRLVITEGLLPPGLAGKALFTTAQAEATALATGLLQALEVLTTARERPAVGAALDTVSVPVRLELAGLRLEGDVTGLLPDTLGPDAGPLPPLRVAWRYGRARVADQIRLWVRHLALTVTLPRAPLSLLAVRGRDRREAAADLFAFPPMPKARALSLLADLVTLARDMYLSPSHLYPVSADAWVRALSRAAEETSRPPELQTARDSWTGHKSARSDDFPGEAEGAAGLLLTGDARRDDYPFDHKAFRDAALRLFTPLQRALQVFGLPLAPGTRITGPRAARSQTDPRSRR